ncbi:MAG: hypothetical protein M1426_02750 [Patescibacteria group bacterium]|nr:hypothetical protein [Patescibacteria group bacterium]
MSSPFGSERRNNNLAETIEDRGSGPKWHWDNVMRNLATQGGLKGVTIDPLSSNGFGFLGEYNGNRFAMTWTGAFLLLTLQVGFSQDLVDAFSKVMEYKPFCQYERDGQITIEWDKIDPQARISELQGKQHIGEVKDLTVYTA